MAAKRPSTQRAEKMRAKPLKAQLGQYSLVSLTPDVIATYRDERLEEGKSVSTVRLELALLGHLYTTAIKEWGIGLGWSTTRYPLFFSPTPETACRYGRMYGKSCNRMRLIRVPAGGKHVRSPGIYWT